MDREPARDRDVVIFDVETTGTDRVRDQIIELGVQFGLDGPGGPGASQVWRIRPTCPMSPGAQAVHGISMEDLEGCPSFGDVARDIREVIDGARVLIGYNLAFDIEMLQAELHRSECPPVDLVGKQLVDPFRLWQRCEPRSLQAAHRRFVGQEFAAAHSASADVAATGRVLRGMLSHFKLAGDWTEIAQVCEPERDAWVGSSRHIRWDAEGRLVLGFGRHAGTPLSDLARGPDATYLQWILDKDFPLHVREMCRRALELEAADLIDWVRRVYSRQLAPPPPASADPDPPEPDLEPEPEGEPEVESDELDDGPVAQLGGAGEGLGGVGAH